jgi:hypothetical protein
MPDDYGCSCSLELWDDEGAQACWSDRLVKGRKAYTCCECRTEIPVGEEHEVASAVQDGKWWTQRTCLPCSRIRKAYCCTWVYGGLKEALWESFGFDYITGEIAGWADEETSQ